MNDFVIIADSCLDLNKSQREEFKIDDYIPGKVYFPDGRVDDADVDWGNISYEDFYKEMAVKKHFFKTSLPNEYETTKHFEKYLEEGKDIIAICLSSKISGTYNQFVLTANKLMEKYKGRKIYVVDSLKYSSGVGLLCIYASIYRDQGMNAEETFKLIEKNKLCLRQIGFMDDLSFLARSGRIPKIKSIMGTLVGVKPIADMSNETGLSYVIGKVRGYKKAFKIMVDYFEKTVGTLDNKILIVCNSYRDKEAKEIKKMLEQKYSNKILMTQVGQSNGSNVGPGLCCIFYLSDTEISKDMINEKKLFLELSKNGK